MAAFRNFANAPENCSRDDGMSVVLVRNVRKHRKFSLRRDAAYSENTEGSEVVWKITLKEIIVRETGYEDKTFIWLNFVIKHNLPLW
jgi:hypothetical protein